MMHLIVGLLYLADAAIDSKSNPAEMTGTKTLF